MHTYASPTAKPFSSYLRAAEGAERHVGHPALAQHAQARQQVLAVGGVGLRLQSAMGFSQPSGPGAVQQGRDLGLCCQQQPSHSVLPTTHHHQHMRGQLSPHLDERQHGAVALDVRAGAQPQRVGGSRGVAQQQLAHGICHLSRKGGCRLKWWVENRLASFQLEWPRSCLSFHCCSTAQLLQACMRLSTVPHLAPVALVNGAPLGQLAQPAVALLHGSRQSRSSGGSATSAILSIWTHSSVGRGHAM